MSFSTLLALTCCAAPGWNTIRLNDDGGMGMKQNNPMAVQTDLGILAAWTDHRNGHASLRARLLPADGSPANESLQLSETSISNPLMSAGPDGRTLLVWSPQGTSEWKAQWLDADGTPSGDAFTLNAAADEESTSQESMTVGSNGNILISWMDSNGDWRIVSFDSTGTRLNEAGQLASVDDFILQKPILVAGEDGSYLACWLASGESYNGILTLRSIAADGTPGEQLNTVELPDDALVGGFDLSMGDDDIALLSWSHATTSKGIYAQRVDLNAQLIGEYQQINTSAMFSVFSEFPDIAHVPGTGWTLGWENRDTHTRNQIVSITILNDGSVMHEADRVVHESEAGFWYEEAIMVSNGDRPALLCTQWDKSLDDRDIQLRLVDAYGDDHDNASQASDDTDSTEQMNAVITPLADGGFAAAWVEKVDRYNDQIMVRSFNGNQEPRGEAIPVSDLALEYTTGSTPFIASSDAGIVVGWTDTRDLYARPYIQRFDLNLQKLGQNVPVTSRDAVGNLGGGLSDLTMTDDGSVAATFTWKRDAASSIFDSYLSVFTQDSNIASENRINTDFDAFSYRKPTVAALPDGEFAVAYVVDSINDMIYYRRHDSNGTPITAPSYVITADWWFSSLELVSNDQGDLALFTTFGFFVDNELLMIPMGPDGPTGADTRVDLPNLYNAPRAAMNEDGTCLVSWTRFIDEEGNPRRYRISSLEWSADQGVTEAAELLPVSNEAIAQKGGDPIWLGNRPMISCSANEFEGQGADAVAYLGGSACSGDLDGSGAVDVADVLTIIAAWGSNDPAADLDDDGIVNINDLLTLLAAFGCEG